MSDATPTPVPTVTHFGEHVRLELHPLDPRIATVVLDRPERRNAVDRSVANALRAAFEAFDADASLAAAVLWGAGGTFCAGADLTALNDDEHRNEIRPDGTGPGPMGPTRLMLGKPVIAAIAGHAVAGGLELAAWCDLRVVEEDAVLGVFCRPFGVPLIVVVDTPGYLPGVGQEWDGVVRRGAKLLHAFAEAVVPRVTLVTRKAYGGAYIAMNSRSLGATRVFAWPSAELAVMGAVAAVRILHRRTLAEVPAERRHEVEAELAAEHEREVGGLPRAIALGVVDEIVEPAKTRQALARAIAEAPARRGAHGNIPL